jgi:hypothetical protein
VPLQNPVVPQVVAPWSLQVPVGSVPPAAIGEQVPAVPVSAQERQLAVQLVAQQTPCAQMPLVHSLAAAQGAPFPLRPHEPARQTAGATQSASAVQLVRQVAVVPQRYG